MDHTGAVRSYPARFHMLLIFALLAFVNQLMYLSFASIPHVTAIRYDLGSTFFVTGMAVECVILYLPGAYITFRILERWDLRRAVITGCALMVLGTLVRCAADILVRPHSAHLGFAVLMLGQGLTAIAAPTFMNTPVLFAEAWFGPQQREGAVAAGTLAPLLGQGIGSAMSGFIVTGAHGEGTSKMLLLHAVLAAVLGAWALVAFRSKPPTPPSRTAGGHASAPEASTFALYSQLLCRPQFVLILCIFVGGLGATTILLTLFTQIIGKCGYGSEQGGIASALFMAGGIAGTILSGAALGATQAYRPVLKITVMLACFAGIVFLNSIHRHDIVLLYVTATVFGACMLACLPCLLTNAAEETFPAPSDASTSLLYVSAIIVQIPLTPIAQAVLNSQGSSCGHPWSSFKIVFYVLSTCTCIIPVLLYRGKYNRLEAEMEREGSFISSCSFVQDFSNADPVQIS